MTVQQLALMRMPLIGDYCCYHMTHCTDRIIFICVLGQYRTDTDAVDWIGDPYFVVTILKIRLGLFVLAPI